MPPSTLVSVQQKYTITLMLTLTLTLNLTHTHRLSHKDTRAHSLISPAGREKHGATEIHHHTYSCTHVYVHSHRLTASQTHTQVHSLASPAGRQKQYATYTCPHTISLFIYLFKVLQLHNAGGPQNAVFHSL